MTKKYVLILFITALLLLLASISTTAQTVIQSFPSIVQVNFQEQGVNVPAGYVEDFGAPFSEQNGLTYGWVAEGYGAPVSMVGAGRDRNRGIAQRIDTFIHFELATDLMLRGWWEIAAPNGTYNVTVSVGDREDPANGYDSVNTIVVEGVTIINGFVGNNSNIPNSEHLEATQQITVSDGRISMDDGAGTNTKVNYIIIELVELAPGENVEIIEPGLSIINLGTVQIGAGTPTPIFDTPDGQPISDGGAQIILPRDADGNGFDTYVVTETAIVDGQAWLALFVGGRNFGWVPLSSVALLTPIDGLDLSQIELQEGEELPLVQMSIVPEIYADGFLIVDTGRLNLRSGDGAQYSIVTSVPGGTELNIIGRNDDRSWWYVEVNGRVGWVNAEFVIIRGDLTNVPEEENTEGDVVPPVFIVYSDSMTYVIRSTLLSNRLCEIAGGVEYPLIARNEASDWFLIQTRCGPGWIEGERGAVRNIEVVDVPVQ